MITEYKHQQNAVKELIPILSSGSSSCMIGATGVGKTYILATVLERLFLEGYFSNSTSPFPVIYLTKSSIVQQTREVLFKEFKLDPKKIFVVNYDQMRATLGQLFITWQEKYSANLTDKWLDPTWRKEFIPQMLICDECQALKNEDSLQSKIALEYVKQGGQVLATSATPFTRVCEARFITLALQPRVEGFGLIKDNNWNHFAQVIAGSQSKPEDWNNEAVKRLTKILENKLVRVKNVRFKEKTHTSCNIIQFRNKVDLAFYSKAYEDYLTELAKIDKDAPGGVAAIWVAQTKFRIRAETIKAPYLAEIAKEIQEKDKKQIIIASNFVKPLELIKYNLIKLGVEESKIALIVGGQSKEERQININRFQDGECLYCLLTLKSGGVGLSLHHHLGNLNKGLPRYVLLPPTWSAIELVQVLGRAHRINSISETNQSIIWFANTIEEEVAAKVARKLHCLSELVSKKETWSDVFSKQSTHIDDSEELQQLAIRDVKDTDEDGQVEEFAAEAFDNT